MLLAYVALWTLYGVISNGANDLHFDMTELIAWSRDLALGFPKHPPFAAIVVRGWFAIFPTADWAYYLLAISTSTIALWIAWELYADYLSPIKRVIGLALLTFIPFYNFLALKFNVNTVLIPLWAVTTFWFLRSYKTSSPHYAALAGVGAAFSMNCKYWSGFFLAGLAVAAVSDNRRSAYFRSAAPWITIVVGFAILAPHIGWLEKHQFSPIQYALDSHGYKTFADTFWHALRYILGAIGYIAVPIFVMWLAANPSREAIKRMVWPADRDLRLVATAFWSTLLLPLLAVLAWGIELHSIWTMSCWTLLPVLLLSSQLLEIRRLNFCWIVSSAVALPFVVLFAAPGVALVSEELGIPPLRAHIHKLAGEVELAWHDTTAKPLRYVGGDKALADGVAAYAKSNPQVVAGLPQNDSKRLNEFGEALVCYTDNPRHAEDHACRAKSKAAASRNPASREIQTKIARSYLGIAGKPQGYIIYIIPPLASPEP